MSFEEEIREKVAELSRDLEGDLELQLDVEFELENHLWESYDANLARGMNEEESAEQAFKDFGSLNEVKERLLAGNLKRLNKRAQAKAILWYVFVPLSIITALCLGGKEYYFLNQRPSDSDKDPRIVKLRTLENTFHDQFSDTLYDELKLEMPNNAYLDSLWMAGHLEDSIDTEKNEVVSEKQFQVLLNRMQEMVDKPNYTAFREEEMAVYHKMGRPSFLKKIADVGQAAGFILPDLASLRKFGRAVVKRGKVEEVLLLEKICRQRLENADTLIEVLVIGAIGGIYIKNENLQGRDDVRSATQFFGRCSQVIADWKKERALSQEDNDKLFNERSGVLTSLVLPAIGTTEEMRQEVFYKASREMEYNFFEKFYFSVINAISFILIFILIAFLSWLKYIKKQKGSLQLYTMKDWFLHWGKFIALPLIAYQIYKLLPFASIHWNIKESIILYPSEILILTFILFFASSWVLFCKYRKKLQIFDLVEKNSLSTKRATILMICLLLPLSCAVFFSIKQVLDQSVFGELIGLMLNTESSSQKNYVALLLIIVSIISSLLVLKFFKIPSVALHSIVQSQLLNLSFVILSLSVYSFIYLSHLETENAKEDQLFQSKMGFTSVEEKVTQQLIEKMQGNPTP